MKSLCLKLGLLSLALFACFGLSHTAKAEITIATSTIAKPGGYATSITIPFTVEECDGAVLVATAVSYAGASSTSFTYNGESLTYNYGSNSFGGNSSAWTYYILDPTPGNHNLYYSQSANEPLIVGAIQYCGVDLNDPIESSFNSFATSQIDKTGISVGNDGAVIWGYALGGGGNNNFAFVSPFVQNEWLEHYDYSNAFATAEIDTGTYTMTITGVNTSMYGYIVFNPGSFTPITPDTNTPIVFQNEYLLYTNSTGLARFTYDTTTFASSTDYLSLYKCGSLPLGTQGAISCSGATLVGTSTIWSAPDIAFNSPSGNGILSMTSTSSVRTLYYVVPTKTGSTNLYYPVYFYVSWNNGIVLDPNDFIGTTSSSSLELLMGGVSTYSAACSYDEWNSTSTYIGLNLTLARCSATKAALDMANIIGRIPTNVANGFISVLQNLFPFNIPMKIKESFDNSTSTLPVSLNYFNIADSNGNLAITLPEEWVGSTTPVAVWGAGVMTENEDANAFFAGIKAFSTYIMWFMFIIYIWHKALDIKEEATLERMPPTEERYPKDNYRY